MKKVLAALVAAGVLVAGGLATAAISAPTTATAQTTTEDQTTDDSGDATTGEVTRPDRGSVIDEVLDNLVAEGVITSDQAERIKSDLTAKHAELRAQFGDRHRGHRGFGDGLRGLLDDGVIDADELAELPEDHPIFDADGPFAPYLDDGQLTSEELEELRAQLREDGSHFRGRLGPGAPRVDVGGEEVANA